MSHSILKLSIQIDTKSFEKALDFELRVILSFHLPFFPLQSLLKIKLDFELFLAILESKSDFSHVIFGSIKKANASVQQHQTVLH